MAITDTTSPDVKNIVLNLVKKWGMNKGIKLATSQFGIPYQAALFALSTPIGQGAVQDFNQMKSDFGGTIKGTVGNVGSVIKSAFSPNTTQPSVDNQGIMAAGQQALGQTQSQIAAQQAASQATGQGNYQAPIMSQQAMVREAQRTGGTVNPHEATRTFSAPRQPVYGPHGKAEGGPIRLRGGGIVGLDMPVSKPSLFQQLFDYGRNVASMQLGGGVTGAGTGKSDSIPAMLSDGEFIMTAKSVKGMGGGNREKGFKKLNTMMKSAEGRAV